MSQTQIANALGLTGEDNARNIRRIESGKIEASGPIKVAMRYLTQGTKRELFPEYMSGPGLDGVGQVYVFRMWTPRFIACVIDEDGFKVIKENETVNQFEWDKEAGIGLLVLQWIDDPSLEFKNHKKNSSEIILEALESFKKSNLWEK